MSQNLQIYVEDVLSDAAVRRIVSACWPEWTGQVVSSICRGNAALRARMPKVKQSAERLPSFVLTDLDLKTCPSELISEWLNPPFPRNLIFRVAVREVEAWILADTDGCADFLGVSRARIPRNPEGEQDPKQTLINIARRSRKRLIKEGIAPQSSIAPVGPAYNLLLCQFVDSVWNLKTACGNARSLDRAFQSVLNRRDIVGLPTLS